jgi:hypothetical protein
VDGCCLVVESKTSRVGGRRSMEAEGADKLTGTIFS